MRPVQFVFCSSGHRAASAIDASLARLGVSSVQAFEHCGRDLAARYNAVLDDRRGRDEIIVFVQEDVSIVDTRVVETLEAAMELHAFAVVGVAGTSAVEIAPHEGPTTWHRPERLANSGAWEEALPDGMQVCMTFGPTPQRCIVLDGCLLAVDSRRIGAVRFDEGLGSHFHDLDFCLAADRAGLLVGTTNVFVRRPTRAPAGGEAFEKAQMRFRSKWGGAGVWRRSVGPQTITLEDPAVRAAFHAGPMRRWIAPLIELPEFLPGSTTAWHGHIPFLSLLIDLLRPRTCVELGVDLGASFLATCTFADRLVPHARCFGIDTWQGDKHAGHVDGDEIHAALEAYVARRFRHARLIRSTFAQARSQFADGSVDLLHIDGLHTYEAVTEDFHTWLPKLSQGGVVMFHDTTVRAADFGVWRLWAEISGRYPSIEFEHSHGLGVLFTGRSYPAGLQELIDLAATDRAGADLLKRFCAVLGGNIWGRLMRRNQCLPGSVLAETSGLVSDKSRHAATRTMAPAVRGLAR